MRQTIDQIVAGAELPLSIIIVGIGEADFTNMNILDADDVDLVDSNRQVASRDIVQFVGYNEYKGDIGLLAQEVLCEVPDQLVDYMLEHNFKPVPVNKSKKKGKK